MMKTSSKTRRASSRIAHHPSPTALATALMLACVTPVFAQEVTEPEVTKTEVCQTTDTSVDGGDGSTGTQACEPTAETTTAPMTTAPMATTQSFTTLAASSEQTGTYIVVDGAAARTNPALTDNTLTGSIAIGPDAYGSNGGVAIGWDTMTNQGVAVGPEAQTGTGGVAVGSEAGSFGFYGVSIGTSSDAGAERAVALGSGARVTARNAVALGSDSYADVEDTVSVGSISTKRQILNVAAGTRDTDAVNFAQLSQTNDRITGHEQEIDRLGVLRATPMSSNTSDAIADGDGVVAIGYGAIAYGNATAIGQEAYSGNGAIAVGFKSDAGAFGLAVGNYAWTGFGGVALGYDSSASQEGAVAIGIQARGNHYRSVPLRWAPIPEPAPIIRSR